jgi:hypothetical protein
MGVEHVAMQLFTRKITFVRLSLVTLALMAGSFAFLVSAANSSHRSANLPPYTPMPLDSQELTKFVYYVANTPQFQTLAAGHNYTVKADGMFTENDGTVTVELLFVNMTYGRIEV